MANTITGSYDSIIKARDVANVVGGTKRALLLLIGLGIAFVLIDAADGSESTGMGAVIVFGSLVWMGIIYVTFGWFEHTLLMLTEIAFNTADDSDADEAAEDDS